MNVRPETHAATHDPDRIWCNLSYDVAWEASPAGVIRCRTVLNRRGDIFKAVEGVNLRAVFCEGRKKSAHELLQEGRPIRHAEVRLPRAFGPERLYLTAGPVPGGGAAGTFCAVDPQSDEVFNGHLALLNHVTEARAREEDYRYEAEIMLQGLRVLLSQSTTAQKIRDLAGLAVSAIRGTAHIVLEVQRDGGIRSLADGTPPIKDGKALAPLWQSHPSPVSLHREGEVHTRQLRALVAKSDGDVAVIFLPVASDSIALVCASRRDGGFRPEDIGFASRFALVLRQALVLKDEQDKLVQAARLSALGQMSASLAHELRQPLNTISMAAQNLELMAENGPVSAETLTAKVSRILGQIERASQIMDRIRRFSRKGGGVFAEIDIAQLVEGVRLLMEHDVVAAGIRLVVDVPHGIRLCCDAIQIEQVLTNLVRNAMDALMGIGTVGKTDNGAITIRGRRTEGGTSLRVEDNGPGFPADVVRRPLETFYTSKGAEAGTGLGLSICHMIARHHAGDLEIGNSAGGAFVELRLPERSNTPKA